MVENLQNICGIGIGHNFPHDSIDMNWGPIAPWKPEVQTLDDFDLRLGRLARAPFGFPIAPNDRPLTWTLESICVVVKVSDNDT